MPTATRRPAGRVAQAVRTTRRVRAEEARPRGDDVRGAAAVDNNAARVDAPAAEEREAAGSGTLDRGRRAEPRRFADDEGPGVERGTHWRDAARGARRRRDDGDGRLARGRRAAERRARAKSDGVRAFGGEQRPHGAPPPRAEAHEPAAPPLAAHGIDYVIIAGVARRIETWRARTEGDCARPAQLYDETLGRGARDGDVNARRNAVASANPPRHGDGAIDAYRCGGAARQEGCPHHLLSSSCMAHGCCPYVQVRNSAASFDR